MTIHRASMKMNHCYHTDPLLYGWLRLSSLIVEIKTTTKLDRKPEIAESVTYEEKMGGPMRTGWLKN